MCRLNRVLYYSSLCSPLRDLNRTNSKGERQINLVFPQVPVKLLFFCLFAELIDSKTLIQIYIYLLLKTDLSFNTFSNVVQDGFGVDLNTRSQITTIKLSNHHFNHVNNVDQISGQFVNNVDHSSV